MNALPFEPFKPAAPIDTLLAARTGAGVTVAVIDSGWSRSVCDMRVRDGVGFVDPTDESRPLQTPDDNDRIGHGTACADLVLRTAPQVAIVPLRVFGRRLETSPEILLAALEWAIEAAIPLVNLSLGTTRPDAVIPLYRVCERARRRGMVIVAAYRPDFRATVPAAFDNVISVGRTSGGVLQYRPGAAVEVLAAGRHERVRWRGEARRNVGGASFAAPVVTSLVARLLEATPALGIAGVRTFLRDAAMRSAVGNGAEQPGS